MPRDIEQTQTRLLIGGSFLVTVFIMTSGVSDPVNVTKLFLLGGLGGGLITLILTFNLKELWINFKSLLILILLFLGFSLISTLRSEAPFTQNLYGTYGRNTGLLTYLFLAGVIVSASVLKEKKSFLMVVYSLIGAGFINILYGAWVVTFGDFVGWNNPYGNILGTFGNPNFVGSFLGIVISVLFVWLIKPGIQVGLRAGIVIALLLAGLGVQSSNAVQGKVVALGGMGLAIFFYLRSSERLRKLQFPYLATLTLGGIFAIAGALQRGPLADLIYKTSVSLRGEYWAAGARMGIENPISGIGMDTYGDWYRRARDSQALILPGPNTVTNAAHNVVIDFFASGGAPLVITYLLLISLSAAAIIKTLVRLKSFDPIFVSLVVAWAGYHVQSLISINQIGLVIWGWLLSGAVIGYERVIRSESTPIQSGLTRPRNQRVLSANLVAGLGIVTGSILAVPPLSADMAWTKALKSQELSQVEAALEPTYLTPENSMKFLQATQLLEQSKFFDKAHAYALKSVAFNPDYFEAWRALYFSSLATDDEKKLALDNMKRLDPLNRNLLNQ